MPPENAFGNLALCPLAIYPQGVCGIAGILKVHPPGQGPPPPPEAAIPESWLDVLDESIKHRGPDGRGRFRDRAVRPDGSVVDVALVHRRLAIIDPACGAQPMVSIRSQSASDGPAGSGDSIAVAFNGCIYNHRELRAELRAAGHEFTTDHSDTEVFIEGWRRWRERLFERLNGMYAALLWDGAEGKLWVARDLFGEKPLYVLDAGAATWCSASSAAGLLALRRRAGASAALDAAALGAWIGLGYHDLLTPAAGLTQAPPGEAGPIQAVAAARASPRLRSLVEQPRRLAAPSPRDRLVTEWEDRLGAAVARRMEADVPLACFLSGGIDSSLVALAARRAAGRLTTVCVRMPDARYDESPHAELAAAAIGSDHVTVDANADPAADLLLLIGSLGLPFGDSSLLPTFWASTAASEHARAVLSGDGGDEVFLGYDRYSAVGLLGAARLAPSAVKLLCEGPDPKSARTRLHRLLAAAQGDGYTDLLAIFPASDRERLVGAERMSLSAERPGTMLDAQRYDVLHHLPGDLLRKVDTASMLAGIEVRAPFLGHEFATEAFKLPASTVRLGGRRKGLLRAIARKHLPAEIVDRPKMGFAIPIGEWFRTDYGSMRTLLMDHLESAEPFPAIPLEINMKFVRQMIDEHMSYKRDHSQRLYMLLVLSIWARWLARL